MNKILICALTILLLLSCYLPAMATGEDGELSVGFAGNSSLTVGFGVSSYIRIGFAGNISNVPVSHDFDIVYPNTVLWGKNGLVAPGFPLEDGNCTGEVTNRSGFPVDISYSMGNMTGGTQWTIGASPGNNTFAMKVGISGAANIGNFTALSATPQMLIPALGAGLSEFWEFVFYTPTNDPFDDGEPKSGNITLEAEAS